MLNEPSRDFNVTVNKSSIKDEALTKLITELLISEIWNPKDLGANPIQGNKLTFSFLLLTSYLSAVKRQ